MFLNVITEEQIRRDCPHNAPLTLRAFNKISPRQFNTSVSPLNPFEIPRYAPKTVGQFAKALVSQQRDNNGQPTNALAVAAVEQAVLAETLATDYVMLLGEQEEKAVTLEELDAEEEVVEEEKEAPLTRRTKKQMQEARAMGAEDTRTLDREEARRQRKEERQMEAVRSGSVLFQATGGEEPPPPDPLFDALMKTPAAAEMTRRREGLAAGVTSEDLERLQKLESDKGINYGERSSTLAPIQGPSYFDPV